jgi:hypothetical protein
LRRVLSFIGSLIGFVFLLLLLTPLLGPPLYLEVSGASAPGVVVSKREVIDTLADTWMRRLFVDIRYQPVDASEPEVIDVAVDMATYDRMQVSEPVQLRYIPNQIVRTLGQIASARLQSQLPFASFLARIGNVLIGFVIGIAAWLALLWAWSKWRHWSFTLAILLLMFGGVIYIGSNWPAPAPSGPLIESSATIRDMHQVTRIWGGKRTAAEDAVQPYTIVELSFVPRGAPDAVIAVDSIDAGSVPGLEKGAQVPINYSASDLRWAQIAGATRTYYWKNLRSFGIIALILVALMLLIWLGSRFHRSRRGRATP